MTAQRLPQNWPSATAPWPHELPGIKPDEPEEWRQIPYQRYMMSTWGRVSRMPFFYPSMQVSEPLKLRRSGRNPAVTITEVSGLRRKRVLYKFFALTFPELQVAKR